MNERRRDFTKFKNHLMKEKGWKTLICARCGYESEHIHLHHIKPVRFGGEDCGENLIPLCPDCHMEWDTYEGNGVDFGKFLTTISTPTMCALYKAMDGNPDFKPDLSLVYLLQFTAMSYNSKRADYGDNYWNLIKEQNSYFSKYPYSDAATMLKEYGWYVSDDNRAQIYEEAT